jgi:hypothetical protein
MDMRVTGPGGVNETAQFYVASDESQYLYPWQQDPNDKNVHELQGLNRFSCRRANKTSEQGAIEEGASPSGVSSWRSCEDVSRVHLPAALGVNESVTLDLRVDFAGNLNATCVWQVDWAFPGFGLSNKKGRGLCSSLTKVVLPTAMDGPTMLNLETEAHAADVSILVCQYELRESNPCPASAWPGSSSWDRLYPDYNMLGVPKQFIFLRGWHKHYFTLPDGIGVAGSLASDFAGPEKWKRLHPGLLNKRLHPDSVGGGPAIKQMHGMGRNRHGVQGVHLNPLGLFLCTSTPCMWSTLECPERLLTLLDPLAERTCFSQAQRPAAQPAPAGRVRQRAVPGGLRHRCVREETSGRRGHAGVRDAAGACRAISDCHFRKTAIEPYDRTPGIKWLSCTAKWESDITLGGRRRERAGCAAALGRAANSRGPRGPTGPLRTPLRTPCTLPPDPLKPGVLVDLEGRGSPWF